MRSTGDVRRMTMGEQTRELRTSSRRRGRVYSSCVLVEGSSALESEVSPEVVADDISSSDTAAASPTKARPPVFHAGRGAGAGMLSKSNGGVAGWSRKGREVVCWSSGCSIQSGVEGSRASECKRAQEDIADVPGPSRFRSPSLHSLSSILSSSSVLTSPMRELAESLAFVAQSSCVGEYCELRSWSLSSE